MAWSVIRKETDEDYAALNKAARRFADRHGIALVMFNNTNSIYDQVDTFIQANLESTPADDWEYAGAKYLETIWKRCVRRALKEPAADGVAWGSVGFHSK